VNFEFGTDYYPEHWPEERWETDARLMKDMGIQIVRMAEFAWSRLEPKEGEYDFMWLDKAVDLLGSYGIKSVIGTPSPAPPPWIIKKHPEILPVNSLGQTMGFGGRHHNCQSNKDYRAAVARMVETMSKHYAGNEHVIGWQTDNELGNSHDDLCHCPSCRESFQEWLHFKYASIEELNNRWGTVFWSQEYNDFSQIPTSARCATAHNPSLLLDWKRFHSDLIVSFQQFQLEILRKNCPHQFITHNMMGFFDLVDYFDLGEPLDFISHDQYPTGFFDNPQPGKTPAVLASTLDLMRGIKDQTFWIMEQQSGPTGWMTLGRTPEPGQLALWAAQSVAHGADTVVFFRWRSCAVGTEQYWHGILPHSGVPGRRYEELKQMMSSLSPLMKQFKGALAQTEVGFLYSYEENWALEIQPHHPDLDYISQVQKYYDAFYDEQIPVDFLDRTRDFSSYKLLVAPLLYLMDEALEKKLKEYVKTGGNLILTMRTGVKDSDNLCMSSQALPGKLGELLGIEIPEYDCLRDQDLRINWCSESDTEEYKGLKWCDVIKLQGAETLACCLDGWHKGNPVITENTFGEGTAWYVGTEPNKALMSQMVSYIKDSLGLKPLGMVQDGVELVRRKTEKCSYLFALNHTNKHKSVLIPDSWKPLLGNGKLEAY
jgi:beta-galactosidase